MSARVYVGHLKFSKHVVFTFFLTLAMILDEKHSDISLMSCDNGRRKGGTR